MTTEQIITLDCSDNENEKIIQIAIKHIKQFTKYENSKLVPLEALEKFISVLVNKYDMIPQWISVSYVGLKENINAIYGCGIKHYKTHEWLGTVYAKTIYELFAKLTIKMYSLVKSGSVEKREKEV